MQEVLTRDPLGWQFDPSCVLYLPLWRLDGSSFADRSHYGHLATVTGALWGPQGRTFDGDDYINLGTGMSNKFANGMSALMWINAATLVVNHTLIGQPTVNEITFGIEVNTGKLRVIFTNVVVNWYYSTGVITAGAWALVGFTFNNSTLTFYINGVAAGTEALSGSIGTLTEALLEGNGGIGYFKGQHGEVLLYNRDLIALEIQQIYLASKWRYQ